MTAILPRDIAVGIAVGGYWTDISSYVYQPDGLSITRGRTEGANQLGPSSCSMKLINTDGRFCRTNPLGPYYGLFGRNTPLRALVRTVTDNLARTVSNGWGSTTATGSGNSYAYTATGSGGSVLTSDFNVTAGVGTMSIPAVSAYRRVYLASPTARDVGVVASCTLPFSNVTGGPVEPVNITLRGVVTPDYYMVRVTVESDESIKIGLIKADGTIITAAVTVVGLTHTSSKAIRVRAEAEGNTIRARVWQPATTDEPDTWHVTGHDDTLTAAGQVGIRSGVSATNSNTLPVVFSYDDIEVYSPRAFGEVAEWPTERTSPTQSRVPIVAAGVTRRLGQGDAPEDSVLYRAITTQTNAPVAYWPCEDGSDAASFASGIAGGTPMNFTGTPTLASYTGFVASNPIPQLGDSSWAGSVPFYTATNETQVRFLLTLPSAGVTDGARIMIFETSGSVRFWGLYWRTGGSLQLTANSSTGPEVLNTTIGFTAINVTWRFSIELTQNGANIDYALFALTPGASAGGATGTLNSQTVGRVTGVFMGTNGGIALPTSVAFGHITVQSDIDSIFTLADQLAAYDGENAGTRINRLADEEGVRFAYRGALNATGMGPQLTGARLGLIQDAEYAGQGFLGEARGDLALTYVTRAALYNQAATVALDYSAGDLTGQLKAVDDDRRLRNDVTAKRVNGSSERVTIDTGAMSVNPPPDGVGRYKDNPPAVNLKLDSQVGDWAGWRALLGTVEQARYPQIQLNLASVGDRALDLDVGDRLTIDNATDDFVYDQINQLVLGYTEKLSTFEHTLVVNCTPETPYQIAEADLAGVKVDSDASTLNGAVNSSATSLSVAVSDGILWTTSSGLPLDINVGGERITVTAISGASSPQTFTVTRSVNGVVKAHAAGAQVRLFRRPTVAR